MNSLAGRQNIMSKMNELSNMNEMSAPLLPPHHASTLHTCKLRRIERLSRLLDNAYRIPFTRWRFGLDPLLGLVPGVGDTLTALLSLYIVHQAWQLGAPVRLVVRMTGNVAFDWLAGSIPVLGDCFDVAWKANLRNVALLHRHLQK